jgi:hypothetical protein
MRVLRACAKPASTNESPTCSTEVPGLIGGGSAAAAGAAAAGGAGGLADPAAVGSTAAAGAPAAAASAAGAGSGMLAARGAAPPAPPPQEAMATASAQIGAKAERIAPRYYRRQARSATFRQQAR